MGAARMYRRKPIVIEAVEVTPLQDGEFERCVQVGGTLVRLRRGEDFEGKPLRVWNELHRSWIVCSAGDFLRVDTPGDVYPIDRATFEATYELVQEGP